MATTEQYTISQFVEDAKRVVGSADGDRQRVVDELKPLVEKVVWDDGLFDERYRAEPENGRPRYLYHTQPDGALQVYVVEFAPGMPTPVHDHLTWGLIGVCGGAQKTARYQRLDDGSKPSHADLRVIEENVSTSEESSIPSSRRTTFTGSRRLVTRRATRCTCSASISRASIAISSTSSRVK